MTMNMQSKNKRFWILFDSGARRKSKLVQISLTRNSDGKVVVTPEREDLEAAVVCICSWSGGPDGLVTKALRRVGYGGDFFNVTYPGDLSEYERQTLDIPIGKVQVTV